MYYVIAIFMFGVMIAIHELGHFAAAKAFGVRVNEFAIGMGPAIFKKQKGETLYSLRLLPLGGFCAMEGEDGGSSDPRSFESKSRLKRFVILAAGAFMNFVLGLVLVLALNADAEEYGIPVIEDFADFFAYEGTDGLMVGDEFHEINGERIYTSGDVSTYLNRNGGDQIMNITVIRNGEKVTLNDFEMQPTLVENNGVQAYRYGINMAVVESSFATYLEQSWYATLNFVRMVRIGLFDLVTGGVAVSDMSGVVGIVDFMGEVGATSESTLIAIQNIVFFSAFISVNLAVMNLLPLPALDGGRILFLGISFITAKVFRKKLDPKYEGYVHGIGLVLLMGLMIVVMYNDIARIIGG